MGRDGRSHLRQHRFLQHPVVSSRYCCHRCLLPWLGPSPPPAWTGPRRGNSARVRRGRRRQRLGLPKKSSRLSDDGARISDLAVLPVMCNEYFYCFRVFGIHSTGRRSFGPFFLAFLPTIFSLFVHGIICMVLYKSFSVLMLRNGLDPRGSFFLSGSF